MSGPVIWNRIPDDIKEAGSFFTFKRNLKLHIFGQYRGDPGISNSANDGHNNGRNNVNFRNNMNINRTTANQRWRQNVNQPFVSRWNQNNTNEATK